MPRRTDDLPTWDEIVSIAAEHDITRLGVAPADVLDRARTEILRRKAAGLHADMGFTYRNPERSTDPRTGGRRRPLDHRRRARPYRAVDEPERPVGAQARVARYAWVDHYTPLRLGLREIAHRLRRAGHRAVVFADDNSIVDREVAYRAGLGWFGKNANILLPGAGSFFVLGCVVTTAEYADRRTDRRWLRELPALYRRVPHRGDRRPRGGRRQSLSGMARAEAGHVSARAPCRPR